MGIGIWELLLIVLIVILVFGTKRLKNMGHDLGAGLKSFRRGLKGEEKDEDKKD